MKMLDATVDLIVTRGPSATSLKEVGLKAGYSRGLASQRFGSKDKLMALFYGHRGCLASAVKVYDDAKNGHRGNSSRFR